MKTSPNFLRRSQRASRPGSARTADEDVSRVSSADRNVHLVQPAQEPQMKTSFEFPRPVESGPGEGVWQLLRPDGSQCELVLRRAGSFLGRLRGLLGGPVPAPGHGLWLVPCNAVHSFGMQGPIDLLFIDAHGRVVAVQAHFMQWRATACRAARSTIEMRAGEAARLRITTGSRLVRPGSAPLSGIPDASGSRTRRTANSCSTPTRSQQMAVDTVSKPSRKESAMVVDTVSERSRKQPARAIDTVLEPSREQPGMAVDTVSGPSRKQPAMAADTVSRPSRGCATRPARRPAARAAAIAAVAAASLVTSSAKADAAANMNLGYEFLDQVSDQAREDRAKSAERTQGMPDAEGEQGAQGARDVGDLGNLGDAADAADEAGAQGPKAKAASARSGADRAVQVAGAAGAARITGFSGVSVFTEADGAAIEGSSIAGTSKPMDTIESTVVSTAVAAPRADRTASPDSRLAEAEQLYRGGRYDDALPLFRAVVASNPGQAHAWLRIGNLMHRKRDWFDALSAYRRAARPDADPAIREKAVYNVALLNLELARQALKRLERLRADAATDALRGGDPGASASGVGERAVRQLSDQIGTAYGALAAARRDGGPAAGASTLRVSAPAPAPAPGPRTPRPPASEKPTIVEIRQGGVSR